MKLLYRWHIIVNIQSCRQTCRQINRESILEKTKYFYRTIVFTRKGNKVALADIYHPDKTTELEEWMGIVISLADGKHTLKELVDFMGAQYQRSPEGLEDTLTSVIERLLEGKMIKLSESEIDMPYYLASPIEHLDLERAKRLMVEDGYTLH